jgi:hypothetical protein
MSELTEQDLKMYLGTKLKVQHTTYAETPDIEICEMGMLCSELVTFSNNCCDYYFNDDEPDCDIKPILYPLSMLSEPEMKHVMDEIKSSQNDYFYISVDVPEFIIKPKNTNMYVDIMRYYNIVQILAAHRFDINNLISQNKAIAVTNDFNPYR